MRIKTDARWSNIGIRPPDLFYPGEAQSWFKSIGGPLGGPIVAEQFNGQRAEPARKYTKRALDITPQCDTLPTAV